MTPNPLPPPDPAKPPLPWDALADLAAGDLAPEAARTLRQRIEAEPTLRHAYEAAERLEQLLRTERPYALPLGLSQRILRHALPAPAPARPLATLLRVAAAVLVFFSSWFIALGSTPALASVREPAAFHAAAPTAALVGADTVMPGLETWYHTPVLSQALAKTPGTAAPGDLAALPGNPLLIALGGILLAALGLGLGVHWNRRTVNPEGSRGDV